MENYTLDQLLAPEGIPCACGKIHKAGLSRVILESGAIRRLPEVIAGYGATADYGTLLNIKVEE